MEHGGLKSGRGKIEIPNFKIPKFEKLEFPQPGRTWVFTGGRHAAGGFSENRGFRGSTGLFEEVVRWNMCGQDLSGRENFVFNTARSGYDIHGILREFDRRVADLRPAYVAYLSGEEDSRLPEQSLREGWEELARRIEAIGARLLLLPAAEGREDSLEEANLLLEMAGADRSTVEPGARDRLVLRPSEEAFERSGRIALSPGPMKWLFVGDSITHGALHTFGYDSVAQLWEKFLREDWGRPDDIVVNTGVSGATATEYLERLDVRYTPYADADVIVAMFGTNDCCFPDVTLERFREQLHAIIDQARAHGSQIVLRAPQPAREDAGDRAKFFVPFAEAVREAALEAGVPLADHFRNFGILQREAPDRFRALMSDAIHPNAQGHYHMFRELAYAVGMEREGSMSSLDYPA